MNLNMSVSNRTLNKRLPDEDKLDNTNYLIESSFGKSSKNPYTTSAMNKKFNNTENLIQDKTSLMIDNISRLGLSKNNKIEELPDNHHEKDGEIENENEDSNFYFYYIKPI